MARPLPKCDARIATESKWRQSSNAPVVELRDDLMLEITAKTH
jgi:hypothetical protein